MMGRLFKYMIPVLSMLALVSCIENDLSRPYVVAEFTSFQVEGQKSVNIDTETRTVEIRMNELADLGAVKVNGFTLTDDAEVVGGMPEVLDLRNPVTVVLKVYEDFKWTIKADQKIERYIRCDNQAGDAVIDADQKTAYVYVSESQSLLDVKFNEMKLEPEGSVVKRTLGFVSRDGKSEPVTEECRFPMVLDCVVMRYFFVECEGEEIRWSVKVLQKAVDVEVQDVDPWACFARVKGVTDGQGTPVLEYRKTLDGQWMTYTDISADGSRVSALIRGLEPETEYAVRLSSGDVVSAEKIFRTEAAPQLENMSFDDWYLDGKVWMPNLNSNIQIWDTANPGSAAVGVSPTTPETEIVVKGKAAKLETKMVNILGIKKLAAGNIYTGQFDKLAGLGAELDWGVPFGARPIAVRGYYRYSPATIDVAEDKAYKDKLGQMDECQIQIFLAEWNKPFHVNSAKKLFVDQADKSIIAFSEFCADEATGEYARFTLPVAYKDTRTPTYIVISGCASRYGNYFVGGVGSLLYIDEFELVYDPAELTDEELDVVFGGINSF